MAGLDQIVADRFLKSLARTGGHLPIATGTGEIVHLTRKRFLHIINRHLTAFWDGSAPNATTLWPANLSPGRLIALLGEATGKYAGDGALITLSNGITAKLVIENGTIKTFYPVSGPGVVKAAELVQAAVAAYF